MPAAQGGIFSLRGRHFPFRSCTASPQSTDVLLHTHILWFHMVLAVLPGDHSLHKEERQPFGQWFDFFLSWNNSQKTKIVLLTLFVLSAWISNLAANQFGTNTQHQNTMQSSQSHRSGPDSNFPLCTGQASKVFMLLYSSPSELHDVLKMRTHAHKRKHLSFLG